MRIGYFTKGWGASDFSSSHESVVAALRRLGHEVVILTLGSAPQPQPMITEEERDGLRVLTVHPGWSAGDRFRKWLGARWLDAPLYGAAHDAFRRYLARLPDLDVLHVEFVWPFALAAVRAARRNNGGQARGRPRVVASPQGHDIVAVPAAQFGSARFPLVRRKLRALFRHVDGVRALTPLVVDVVCGEYGADPAKVHLVRRSIADRCFLDPSVDLPAYRAACRSDFAGRHALGDGPLLVAVSRVMPIKGIADMLRAMAKVRTALPGARLAIVGETQVPGTGDYGARMMALARDLRLEETVRFLGHLPHGEIPGCLAAADLFISTTLKEPYPKTIAEAAAMGTPAVFTYGHGISAYFDGRGASRIVPTGDCDAIAAAVVEVLSDPDAWQAMSRRCVEVAQEFRADAVAPQLAAMYERVLAHG